MPPAPLPSDESDRVAALYRMNVLDTPAEERLDRIVKLAAVMLKTPASMITMLEGDRQWFKASHGVPVREMPRAASFCGYAILGDETLVIEDASRDARFSDNPVVAGEPHVRFYMGCPIRSPEGKKLGTLCVVDMKPHQPTEADLGLLQSLAEWAQGELHIAKFHAHQQALVESLDANERKRLLDDTTHLWNRHGIERMLQPSAAVIGVAIDGFSRIGQAEAVLKQAADWLRSAVRAEDALGYCGDGRFVAVLADTDEATANEVAETIGKAMQRAPVAVGDQNISITASTVVAMAPPDQATLEAAADRIHRV